ncbi:aminodeoxychorismate synthase component I [Desulforamulus hydrothermalis]|uniref:aminodeoxychorismate synthase n=1 Tax=Desulforamulus hydrothermalis Lam5 = DSM 18033 TaxID=1121428 RepID=K8E9F8_9FIRM|nr:aminodeoxychorismate synthase component I [Desulforamulus hydrothermalis]CCO08198.1 Para-aminobenzoate synthase component 1 [Desulforamulus hydrothermalis Lam5 = DSM 18033]SHH22634.1 para-aminobenzoate synthetase component 1 [Desulforamulus hydrothermalis Lam5 = DSM 18033]
MIRKPLLVEFHTDKTVDQLFASLKELPYSFLLATGQPAGEERFSFLGADPYAVIVSKNGLTTVQWRHKPGQTSVAGNPLDVMKNCLARLEPLEVIPEIPFTGGAVGFFSYDLGRQLEQVPAAAADDLQTPDLCFGLYDVVLVADHLTGQKIIVSTGHPAASGAKAAVRARARAAWLRELLQYNSGAAGKATGQPPVNLRANFTGQSYRERVRQAVEHILNGDIFQVNLSQRFELQSAMDSWQLFQDLKSISPAPQSAYLKFPAIEVVCSSPERFLQLNHQRQVITCPIKGTRPRGANEAEDLQNYLALKHSDKDRAELTMIVDLSRSDLGKVCEIGSVEAEMPYRIETFSTVHHLVAAVRGQLPGNKGIFDLLKAAFPGGSITGAPKIKAMEIIDRLEPVRRGIYTGSLGYIGLDGRADLNIVIRTVIKVKGRYYFHVGGGITAKSDAAAEYYETLDKAKALLRALRFEGSIYHGPYTD